MIRVILEGRDAPLYHCTSLANAMKILDSGFIKGGILTINKGVSVTRDKSYWIGESEVQFILNQRKIVQTKKIIPYADTGFTKGTKYFEAEEVILSDKLPISDYVTAVDVKPDSASLYVSLCTLADIYIKDKGTISISDEKYFNSYESKHLALVLSTYRRGLGFGKHLSEAFNTIKSTIDKLEY